MLSSDFQDLNSLHHHEREDQIDVLNEQDTPNQDDVNTNNIEIVEDKSDSDSDNDELNSNGIPDDALCRICKQPHTEEDPLFHPCKCSGSIKYIHGTCLMEWMKHSNKGKYCEICKHEFKFAKVYSNDAPKQLSPLQVMLGAFSVLFNYLKSISRILLVIFVWIVLVPFITYQFYRIVNITSWSQIVNIFDWETLFKDYGILTFFRDCTFGATICIFVLLLDLITAGVLEFIKSNLELLENYVNPQRLAPQENVNNQNNPNEIITLKDLMNNQQLLQDEENNDETNEIPQGEADEPRVELEEMHNAPQEELNQNPPIAANPPPIQNGAREDLDLDVMIGLKGDISHLFETVALVLFLNSQHILLLLFLPLQFGRFICHQLTQYFEIKNILDDLLNQGISKNGTFIISNNETNQTWDRLTNDTIFQNIHPANTTSLNSSVYSDSTAWIVGEKMMYILTGYLFLIGVIYSFVLLNYVFHNFLSKSWFPICNLAKKLVYYTKYIILLVKIATILTTNFIIVPLAIGYLLFYSTDEFFKNSTSNISSIMRQGIHGMDGNSTMQQMSQTFNASITNYTGTVYHLVEHFQFNSTNILRELVFGVYNTVKPYSLETILSRLVIIFSVSFVYFVFGIIVVVVASSFIQMLRSFLSKRVLWFLRDPDDPNFHYLKELVTISIFTHMRRITFSFFFLSIIILALVRTPLKMVRFLLQDYNFFPFKIGTPLGEYGRNSLIELTIDTSLPIIIVNYMQQRWFNLEKLKWVLKRWFEIGGSYFSLESYFFDSPTSTTVAARDINLQRSVRYPTHFPLRISLFILITWCGLIEIISLSIILPLLLGKFVLDNVLGTLLGVEMRNHFYTYMIGLYLFNGIMYILNYIYTERSFEKIIKWTTIVFKCTILFALWFILVPILIGGAIEMSIVVPTKLAIEIVVSENFDDSLSGSQPVLLLAEVWSLGLFFSITILKLPDLFPGLQHLAQELTRVKQNGFRNVELLRVVNYIILPVVYHLVLFLTVPYIVNKTILPFFVLPQTQYHIFVFSYPSIVALLILKLAVQALTKIYNKLHDIVMDKLYLSKEVLVNHGEAAITGVEGNQ
ncbi:hypothetical protein C9374_005079 [Naegleria lovaniensis]|uniref:RING-type E3 ubiquitin transferase n=1 Tax=Naegleria lovaniensis TaxID=51637 RepID=A0AA88GKA1_NAELO|nr:uncharacterized protein C9374_005079 [Naegleria lovaniensis]KAG2382499.1 hypothetical protein C9374_005079 [Naegleria lovaniensis]